MAQAKAIKILKKNVWVLALTLVFFLLACGISTAATDLVDENIESAVEKELSEDQAVPAYFIDVSSMDNVVTLSGSVGNLLAKERAVSIAKTVKGVRSVVNRIAVEPVTVKSDSAVYADVTEALLSDPVTELYEIDTSVDNGVVTLEGQVNSYMEKAQAERVAKSVSGVKEVDNLLLFDHKTSRPDKEFQADIKKAMRWDTLVDQELVQVSVNNKKVTLKGTVGSAAEKDRAINHAWMPGIKEVDASLLKADRWARDRDLRQEKYILKTDDKIKAAVEDALLYDPRVLSTDIDVNVNNGVVKLRGTVDYLNAKRLAAQDARNTVGVIRVENQLKVSRPAEERTSNELEQKIMDKFDRDPYMEDYALTVEVVAGVADLYGTVDSYFEKTRAENLASDVRGIYVVDNKLIVTKTYDPYVYKPYVDESYIYDYDWYTYQPMVTTTKDDQKIKENIESEFFWSPFVDGGDINISVDDGKATLTGEVDSWSEYDAATQNSLEGGAVAVDNELTISYRQ